MKQEQNNTHPLAALLRSTRGVDVPVENSLCCGAAGITDFSSSTTEVLKPHDKLRRAAPPATPLIAQNRMLAQPVIGCDTPTYDLIQKIQIERISITWEYEGGCHVWRYWDSDAPCEKAYGDTIQEALERLQTPNN